MKRLLMEFLGTFFFIFTITMTANPIAIAAMLMAWVYIGAFVSGSHYNPLLSFAVALRGRLAWHDVPWYMLAQILGGFVAFALTAFLHGAVAIPSPAPHVTFLQALIVETLLSFVLALIVLVVVTSEKYKGNDIFGLAIGFTVLALAVLGATTSGGLFNPAIALGGTIYSLLHGVSPVWEHVVMYVGGAFLGAFLAAAAFHYFVAEYNEEIILFKFVKK